MKKLMFALAAGALCAAVPAHAAPKPVELSPTELAAVQNRSYNVPSSTAFSASVAALQALGYVDIVASKDAGTISGTTESKAKVIYNIIWGLGKKKYTQKASLLVEENGPGVALVRLNLHVNETKSRGIFGTAFSDGKLVRVADPYQDFYTALDGEITRRSPIAGGTPANGLVPVSTVVLNPGAAR